MVKDPGLSMNAKQFDDNIPTLKKLREASTHLFDQFSEGCLYNYGHTLDEDGKCMHDKSLLRSRKCNRQLRRSCSIWNCPKLD